MTGNDPRVKLQAEAQVQDKAQVQVRAQAFADRLLAARGAGAAPAQWHDLLPADTAGAYAVQDAVAARLGPIGGWKVGAKGPTLVPACAPLPASGLLQDGAVLAGPPWLLRGLEVEVAFRLARDLAPADDRMGTTDLAAAIDCVLPVVEVVETRLAHWRGSDPLAQLADLQSHGALVLGAPCALPAAQVDLRRVQAYLALDGQPVASARGANPAGDVWRLLAWLAFHCVQRGQPLRAGQIVTTGSCSGMLFAPEGARVQAQLEGIGGLAFRF